MSLTKSLRVRIQLWHGLLLIAVLAGFGWTAWRLEYDSRIRRVDVELQTRLAQVIGMLRPPRDEPREREGRPPPRPRLLDEASDGGNYYTLWRPGGEQMLISPSTPVGIREPTRAEAQAQPPVRVRGEYREWIHIPPPGGTIVVGRSLAADFAEMRRLAWLLAGAGGGVLLLALGVGWWLTSLALRPLDAITATAGRISGGDLSGRIVIADPGSELGQLASILNATFARLEDAFAVQARFTADAAHELRTPVSIVLSQAQLGLRAERTTAEYREMLDACLRAAQRMQRLIDSLLDLARLDARALPLQRQPCDLADLARACASQLRPAAAERRITLDCDLPAAPCEADAGRIEQIIANLLANALEHTPDLGCITLRTASNHASVTLSVSDTGSGIAPEHLPRVFERFYRADPSRTRSTGGAGLGLSICKTIADAHGASLEVASTPGEGSTFTLRLPR